VKATILNREFQHPADGWYQIEVPGEHPNQSAGLVQVIDGQAVKSIVNRFNQEADDYAARTGRTFPGLAVDIEHFHLQPDKETRAYGWLMRLENRNGVPFGKIQWTATGQPAVDGGDYRFFSTEYNSKDFQILNSGQTPARVRPMRLAGLTLTNEPNNKGGSPITNRENYGSHGTKAAWEAAEAENTRHIEANKAATQAADAQLKDAIEGQAAVLSPLEIFCQTVKSVMEAATKSGHQMMSLPEAWTYAQTKFPDIYAAAFGVGTAADTAQAAKQVTALANRIGALAGKPFDFGWQFVREELPQIFNRMTVAPGRIQNRAWYTDPKFTAQRAAKVFNRLVRAESAVTGAPQAQALKIIRTRHPGISGLAEGRYTPHDALTTEPGISALMSEK